MKRILALVLIGLISGVAVWAVTIGVMPRTVMQQAFRRSTSVERVNERTLQAPVNQIAFASGLYDSDTDIGEVGATAPMADMLYAQGWLDLTKEPMVFDIPDFGDRYFTISLTDMCNLNTGYIGTRATGNQGGRYAVTWKGWEGPLPSGVTPVTVSAPQVSFWYRVFVAGPADLAAADAIRRQVQLYPLSQLGSRQAGYDAQGPVAICRAPTPAANASMRMPAAILSGSTSGLVRAPRALRALMESVSKR